MTKEKIRESLNKLDHKALDEEYKYYDFVNTYDSIKRDMLDEDVQELSKLLKRPDPNQIDKFLSKFLNEEFVYEEAGTIDDSDLNLDRIYESEQMNEENYTPEKNYAKSSGKPYYSLKDKKSGEYVGQKTRTRYKTAEKARERLKELELHKDGEYIDKRTGLIISPDELGESYKLNESIYVHIDGTDEADDKEFKKWNDARRYASTTDAKVEIYQVNDIDGEKTILWASDDIAEMPTLDPLKEVTEGLGSELQQWLKHAATKDGKPFPRTSIIVKLYEMTNKGTDMQGVERSALLLATGTDNKRASITTQSQTIFEELGDGRYDHGNWKPGDGLLKMSGTRIKPTPKLAPFVEGGNPEGIDLTQFIGSIWDYEAQNLKARDMQNPDFGSPLKSRLGTHYTPKLDRETDPETVKAKIAAKKTTKSNTLLNKWRQNVPILDKEKEDDIVYADESLQKSCIISDEEPKKPTLAEIRAKRDEELRKSFRKFANLDEDIEITPEHFGCDKFKAFCWANSLGWDQARKSLLGDKYNENK